MSYGLLLNDENGLERNRFDKPIAAVFSFLITTYSGSRYVRGSYDHGILHVVEAAPNASVISGAPAVTITSDDMVIWSSIASSFNTVLPSVCFVVFNR